MPIKFRSAYSPQKKVQLDFRDLDGNFVNGRTEQCHAKSCDIDYILRQYDKTGLITHVNSATAEYGDFTLVNEYRESLDLVIKAQDAFDELPSKIRKRFGHDPGEFFEFATNPDNHDELVKMGLANPKPVVENEAPSGDSTAAESAA